MMNNFETNIISIYGDRGRAWLADLPAIITKAAAEYGLSDLNPMKNLTYNYVLSGSQDSLPIILKLGIDVEALHRETLALRAFFGFGAVGVLVERGGLLLLERAVPGSSLKAYFPSQDIEAMEIACAVMKRLQQAPLPQGTFSHIKEWLTVLDGKWDIPTLYLEKARALRSRLLGEAKESILLHGDLHHDNILQHEKGWVVIDPKGVVGEPTYEAAAFIRNPLFELFATEEAARLLAIRIKYFAKTLELDRGRLQDWCFVQAVLAWIWTLEEGGNALHFTRLTKILDGLAGSFD